MKLQEHKDKSAISDLISPHCAVSYQTKWPSFEWNVGLQGLFSYNVYLLVCLNC